MEQDNRKLNLQRQEQQTKKSKKVVQPLNVTRPFGRSSNRPPPPPIPPPSPPPGYAPPPPPPPPSLPPMLPSSSSRSRSSSPSSDEIDADESEQHCRPSTGRGSGKMDDGYLTPNPGRGRRPPPATVQTALVMPLRQRPPPPAAPPYKQSDGWKEWACSGCTFWNPTDRDRCSVCETARSKVKDEEWDCSKCTFANPTDMDHCDVCGTARSMADRRIQIELPANDQTKIGNRPNPEPPRRQPRQATAREAPFDDQWRTWRCRFCTFINQTKGLVCGTCNRERTDVWECHVCERLLKTEVERCRTCQVWRCPVCKVQNDKMSTGSDVCQTCGQL